MKSSGLLDTRLYDNPFLLAHILASLDGDITNDEKEIIKSKFRSDTSVLEDIKAEIKELSFGIQTEPWEVQEKIIKLIDKRSESEG